MKKALGVVAGLALLTPAWVLCSSAAFALWTQRITALGLSALWCWPVMTWKGLLHGFWPGDPLALGVTGVGTTALAYLLAWAVGRKHRLPPGGVERAKGATYGSADFASKREARERFPGVSTEGYGGIPVARNYRRDLSRWAQVAFDPRRPETWDDATRAEMLVDPCELRSTMSAWVAGSGVGKSQTLLQALAHPIYRWTGSYVVGDPKGELEAMTRRTREAQGQRVHAIGPRQGGINVLASIDPEGEDFELDVMTLARRIAPEPEAGSSGEQNEWAMWAQQIMWALLAHMLTAPGWPADRKNLRTFKAAISSGQAELKSVLEGVATYSECRFARENARAVLMEASDTWAGVYGTVQAHTAWLGSSMLADMVSDHSFDPADICRKPMTVYLQIRPKALKVAPGVARVLYGCLLDAAYDADGFVRGRILFDIDEAYVLGRMAVFELVRDLGRSYGITVRWWFQALGQLEILYKQGTKAWYASLAYMAFAGVADVDTAKMISQYAGTFGAIVRNKSSNKGTSQQSNAFHYSRSKGEGESELEVAKRLLSEADVLTAADNEVLVLTRGMRIIRGCLPLAFQDEDIRPHLDENPLDEARKRWRVQQAHPRQLAA